MAESNFQSRLEEFEKQLAINKSLKEQIAVLKATKEAQLREISIAKAEVKLHDQEAEMLVTQIQSEEERIAWHDEILIPQLKNDLKAKKAFIESKKEEYRKTLETYENKWKEYEAIYNQYPRVPERNAQLERLELLRVEAANKKKEIAEKQIQAKSVQESKARRLEELKEELIKWHKIEQDEKAKHEELLLRKRELEERIAAKEAKILSQKPIPVVQPEQNPRIIPFKIPTMDSFLDALKNVAPNPFKGSSSSQSQGTDLRITQVTHPPAKLVCSTDMSLGQGRNLSHAGLSKQVEPIKINQEKSGCVKELSVCKPMEPPVLCSGGVDLPVNKSKSEQTSTETPKSPKVVGRPVSGLGNKKKEVILSTDNIAAKMKESVPHLPQIGKSKIIRATPQIEQSSLIQDSSMNQDLTESPSTIDNNRYIHEEPPLLQAESEAVETESCSKKVARQDSGDMFTDDANEETSEPNFNNYNTEFREDMYDDLQSPPPFDVDVAMSPVQATFSSPSSFGEENQTDQQGETASSFGGFGFFKSSSSASNVFGGPTGSTDDQKGQDKPPSSYSFFF